jgi:uncharacterized protein (DUF983 family)
VTWQETWQDTSQDPPLPHRPVWRAMRRGFRGRCPQCAQGRLFRAFLKVADQCPVCGEALHHHRADDAPAYFVILIVGHVVVPLALAVEIAFAPPYWLHAVLWLPLTIGLAIGLLQPIKGAIVGWQWANYMHGFDPHGGSDADPVPQ